MASHAKVVHHRGATVDGELADGKRGDADRQGIPSQQMITISTRRQTPTGLAT